VGLLADRRMAHTNGIEFLQEEMQIVPDGKRALLASYADTSAAITGNVT
jgi:thioredoxin reductase (NADPH)